jgi:hypothetical protein
MSYNSNGFFCLMSKDLAGRLLLAASIASVSWAVLIFATGGFVWETAFFRLASRDPFRPLVAGVICAVACRYVAPVQAAAFLDRLELRVSRRGGAMVAAIAILVAVAGFKYGTYAASGADSYGYISQTDLWLNGHLRIDQRALAFPPPFNDWVLSPLGYHPGPTPHVIVPTYAPGLPLLMASAKTIAGSMGPYYIVPVMGALVVLVTYLLGRLLFDTVTGIVAAALISASPTFQFQLMWPMTDVPAAAAWTLALVFAVARWPFAAGLASAASMMLRPNLAVLALGVAIIALRPTSTDAGGRRDLIRSTCAFAAGAAPAAIGIALLNAYLYGGPTVPSYTHLDSLFRWKHFIPNVTRYVPWLIETQTPFVVLALLPLVSARFTLPATPGERPVVRVGIAAFLALAAGSYIFYQPFDAWWFLRFFLPAFPLLLVLAVGALRSSTPLVGRVNQQVLVGAVALLVLGWGLSTSESKGAYTVQTAEQRYVTVARDLAATMPGNAVFVAMQHSGSVRYYAGRLTVRYDALPPGSLDEALGTLRARGFHPYFLLERWEESVFRERFATTSAAGRIDWPPVKVWPTAMAVALYDPADRSRVASQ